MKVLFVSSGNAKEGISPIIKNQGESLIKQGVQLEFFTIRGKGFSAYLRHVFLLRKKLKESSYDIIHAHFGLSGLLSLLSRRNEVLFVSFMGDDLLGSNRPGGAITFRSRLSAFINKITSGIFFNATIVKSAEMAKKIGTSSNLFLIPNGIDLGRFNEMSKEECRKKLSWTNNENHILFAADPVRAEKNYDLAEKAVQLSGGGDKINLHFVNDVSQDVIPVYLNASDLIILSSFHEGSPNVIKEAMACNCPIVSTDVGDVKWVLGDTEGCFIASFLPVDFATKIKSALEFSRTRGKTNGRQRIIELGLDSDTVAGEIIEAYNKVLIIKD